MPPELLSYLAGILTAVAGGGSSAYSGAHVELHEPVRTSRSADTRPEHGTIATRRRTPVCGS